MLEVAERKKGILEKIMQDFPERRFVLVGNSGETDLELYTEICSGQPWASARCLYSGCDDN